jgi:hypothetical protein
VVNDQLLETVLLELRKHSDIQFKPPGKAKKGSTTEQSNDIEPPLSGFEAKFAGQRVFVSEERMWQELTGHSVDHTRITPKEFECLLVIAATGAEGILQKFVTERTGQDKRSVPKRTDRLAQNGYITKDAVVGAGTKTSILKLKKFSQMPVALPTNHEKTTTEQANGTRQIIFYDIWFDATMKMLQDNGNIAPLADLRAGLGITGKQWETKRFFHCIRRLIRAGCVRTLSAAVALEPEAEGENASRSSRKMHRSNCVQLLRDPTDVDRKVFQTGSYKGKPKSIVPDQEEDSEESDGGDLDTTIAVPETSGAAVEAGGSEKPAVTPPAHWSPLIPLNNQIYDLVDKAGLQGLTAKQLYDRLGGASWHRPIDEALAKITDIWQHSQPPHLRHLTLIRDTVIDFKILVFHFRSLENYRKAVTAGYAVWEAVIDEKSLAEFEETTKAADSSLDEWGFPQLNNNELIRGGRGSLAECRHMFRHPQRINASIKVRRELDESEMELDDVGSASELDPEADARVVRSATNQDHDQTLAPSTCETPDLTAQQNTQQASAQEVPPQDPSPAAVHAIDPAPVTIPETSHQPVIRRKRGRPRKNAIPESTANLPSGKDESALRETDPPHPKRRRITEDGNDDAAADTSSGDFNAAQRLKELFANRPLGRPTRAFQAEAERLRRLVEAQIKEQEAIVAALAAEMEFVDKEGADEAPVVNEAPEIEDGPEVHDGPETDEAVGREFPLPQTEPVAVAANASGAQETDMMEDDDEDYVDDDASEQPGLEDPDLEDPDFEDHDAEDSAPTRKTERPSRVKRAGLVRSGGFVAAHRAKVILDAVHACGGVFPGNNEMWYVVATAWQKHSAQTLDRQTLERAIRNLVTSGKLQKITWTFSDRKGFVHTRAILAEPHIKPQDPVVKAMQRNVEETLPNQYLPKEVEVFASLRHQASSAPGTAKPMATPKRKTTFEITTMPKLTAAPELTTAPNASKAHVPKSKEPEHGLKVSSSRNGGIIGRVKYPEDNSVLVKSLPRIGRKTPSSAQVDNPVVVTTDRLRVMPPADNISPSASFPGVFDSAPSGSLIDPSIDQRSINIMNDSAVDSASLAARFKTSQIRYQSIPSGRHVLPVPVKRIYRKRHEKIEIHPLSQGGEQWSRAWSLLMGLACLGHTVTGTFASRAIISDAVVVPPRVGLKPLFVKPAPPPPRSLRNILDEIESLRKAPYSRQATLNAQLSEDEQDPFRREINTVQAWEEEMIGAGKAIRGEDGIAFVNHTLKVPHVVLKRNARSRRPEGIPLISSIIEPPPKKKKYRSRKAAVAPTLELEEPRPHQVRPAGEPRHRRDRQGAANFADGERLIAAIALIMVTCGGINQGPSWSLISHALSFRYDGEFLRRRWNWIRGGRHVDLEQIRDAIREPFLIAYENDEIPRIDYQNLAATDWPALLDWVEDEVMPTLGPRPKAGVPVAMRPTTVNQALYEASSGLDGAAGRKSDYFTSAIVDHRRQMTLHFSNGTLLPKAVSSSHGLNDDHILLKSWIRAVALTKQWNYNPRAASASLSVFDEATLTQVTQDMIENHILVQDRKGRQMPGRNYQIHQDVLSQFRRWPKQDEHLYLRNVADARIAIDEHFQMYDELDLIATAQDVEYLVLINMVSQGFIVPKAKLPERNDDPDAPHPKLTKWSYGKKGYETKNTNINDLKYALSFKKTPNYTSEHGLQPASIPQHTSKFPPEIGHRIPIWMDIHGQRIDDVWDMAVRSILHILVYRAGSTAAMIETAHNQKLWTWEIDLVLSWMEAAGVAERCGVEDAPDPITGAWRGGWRTSAWWYCAFLPEVADWAAPGCGQIEQHIGLQWAS